MLVLTNKSTLEIVVPYKKYQPILISRIQTICLQNIIFKVPRKKNIGFNTFFQFTVSQHAAPQAATVRTRLCATLRTTTLPCLSLCLKNPLIKDSKCGRYQLKDCTRKCWMILSMYKLKMIGHK